MASKIFRTYKDEIKAYCAKNDLSFNKLCESPCQYDNEVLFILETESYPEREKLGLADNIPMRISLGIYLEDGKLRFEQTDITRKYLGVEEEHDVVHTPRVAVAV
jgi:hypothetical protein